MNRERILLAHLNSLGDCLYATVIAKQIKEVDFINCHLTWAVNSKCVQAVMLNPYVDEIWEIPAKRAYTTAAEWDNFVNIAEQRKKKGDFDIIFYTQIIGKNLLNYDGGIRSSTFNNYPNKITVSQQPVIRLSEHEVENVKHFAQRHQLNRYKNIILVEFSPESFTSRLNAQSALQLANDIISVNKDTAFILSSNKRIEPGNSSIIDASILTFRENAELTKYCTLLVGCSSGISWLTTADWAKPLPKIIATDYYSTVCSSMIYDHEYAGLPTNKIIEFQESASMMKEIHNCINLIFSGNFETAKAKYNKAVALKNYSFVYRISRDRFKRGEYNRVTEVFNRANKRNGFHFMALLYLLKAYFKLPFHLIKWRFKPFKKFVH